MSFQESSQHVYLSSNLTARANVNLVLFSYEFEANADVTAYGNVSLTPVENGFQVKFTPIGISHFNATGEIWFDSFILSIFELTGYINKLKEKMLSFISFVKIFPSIPGELFTTNAPYFRVVDDGILLWLNVNELYLGYDNEASTKNYHYRYIEAGRDYTISPPGNVTFNFGPQGVLLTDGFIAEEGSIFTTNYEPNFNDERDELISQILAENIRVMVLDTARPENINKQFDIPKKYVLYQNYPNPFNPSTTIKYDLKAAGKVTLIIYDILGREVKRLVDWNEMAGYKTVTWNGKDKNGHSVSSGVYFYTLQTADFIKTNKMLIVK